MSCINDLFGRQADRFRDARRGGCSLVHQGDEPPRLLRRLASLELAELLEAHRGPITALEVGGPGRDSSAHACSAREAAELHRRGRTLKLAHLERTFPEIDCLLRRLEHDLHLPAGSGLSFAFASGPGESIYPHFDPGEVISIQLRGRKTWWLEPRPSVPDALHSHVCGDPVDPELARYATALAEDMPDADAVEVRPGGVVYMPAGVYHRTVVHEPSLALSLDFPTRPRSQELLARLRALLHEDPFWRQPVGASISPTARATGVAHAARALRRVAASLREADPAAATVTHYTRAVGVSLEEAPEGDHQRLRLRRGEQQKDLLVDEETASLIRWSLARDHFSLDEAVYATDTLLPARTRSVLSALVMAGALEAHDAPGDGR